MLEEKEARVRILQQVDTGPVIWVPTHLAIGQAVAQDIFGIADYPEFDNSSMDGYAVFADEAKDGAVLQVTDMPQPAGIDRQLVLRPGQAIRIFTGAPIPEKADAVIMQEDVDRQGEQITIKEGVVKGENIRRAGGDVCSGQKIISEGDRLGATRLALLSSQGIDEVSIHIRPMIHVVTTGDELVQLGDAPMPGQIFDSNGILLKSAIEEIGGVAEAVHLEDNPDLMRHALTILCEASDFVVIAGGVSVGERDYVKRVLNDLGVETDFWRVNIKPGKPFLFGKHPNGCLIFGLPGNPVSAFVTFQLFVAPALKRRLGHKHIGDNPEEITTMLGEAGEDLTNFGDRPHYLRATVENGRVVMSGTQQSHAVFGLSKANCLVRIEPGQTVTEKSPVYGIRIH